MRQAFVSQVPIRERQRENALAQLNGSLEGAAGGLREMEPWPWPWDAETPQIKLARHKSRMGLKKAEAGDEAAAADEPGGSDQLK